MMTVTSLLLTSFGLIVIAPVPVNVSDVKEEHSENAPFPIVVTLFGMVIEPKEERPGNAQALVGVALSRMRIDFKEER